MSSNIKTFKITGGFTKRGRKQVFIKEISSTNQDRALDKLYSLIGSNHKVKRGQIRIEKVEQIKAEKAEEKK